MFHFSSRIQVLKITFEKAAQGLVSLVYFTVVLRIVFPSAAFTHVTEK